MSKERAVEENLARLMWHSTISKDSVDGKIVGRLRGFDLLYPTTNEHLPNLFKRLNTSGKKVLTVGSSGDQVLYSVLNGASEVTLVDVNPYAKMFLEYKIASIKTFTFDEFFKIFRFCRVKEIVDNETEKKNISSTDEFLNSAVYRKISHNMEAGAREFWDRYFLECKELYDGFISREKLFPDSYLVNGEVYSRLSKELKKGNVKIDFINQNLKKVAPMLGDRKYDIMLFSNVLDYMQGFAVSRKASNFKRKIVDKLKKNLEPGGVMQIDYTFEDCNNKELQNAISEIFSDGEVKILQPNGFVLYRPREYTKDERA